MNVTSHIFSALLAVLVAFTAQAAAVARTMPDAAGQKMVICTGTGPVMVFIDENGEPTAPPQLCPDFTTSLIVALDVPNVAAVPTGDWLRQGVDFSYISQKVLALGTQNARAPPVSV